MSLLRTLITIIAGALLSLSTSAGELVPPIKVGIIGLDAHAEEWTRIINNPNAQPPVSDLRVVIAYPGFSPDIPFSKDHIEAHTAKVKEMGVEIAASVDDVIAKADAVMILGIDGRPHLQQALKVFAAKKILYVDKPVAASLVDTIKLFRAAKESGTPCFSNSSLRYSSGIASVASDPKFGRVLGCDAYSNNKSILPEHPDLFYYGIHGCEILFTIMGPGCKTVTRVKSPFADIAVGVWEDGRVGTFRGIQQGQTGFGATVFGEKAIAPAGKFEGYEPLVVEIAKFFRTGQPPFSVEHILEIYAFMEAADESQRQGGRPVSLEEVLKKAERKADQQAGK